MLKLNLEGLADSAWGSLGVKLMGFDAAAMFAATRKDPQWVHFGGGNIFRAFIARTAHDLIAAGKMQSGIVAAENYDEQIIDKIYTPHDNLTLLCVMKANGELERHIVAGVGESLKADYQNPGDWARLIEIFGEPGLQLCSFTVTEKGYALRDIAGELLPAAAADMEAGPSSPRHIMGVAAALLLARYSKNAQPIAMVSMDNCSHNGDKLRDSVLEMAEAWQKKGFAEAGFTAWLSDASKVSFPWTMIDKITPRPAENIAEKLEADGIEGMKPIITAKQSYMAAFVNAEEPQYLVIEDAFPNGRPPLEDAGVYFTNRETVDNVERMKVTTCLNPLHTALGIFGCILGYTLVSDEMKDPILRRLVELIGYGEGMPVVVHPGIIDPKDFIGEVLGVRFPNPFMPDAPQRLVTDTSQKIGIRFGETIKAYRDRPGLDPKDLVFIPLVIAGWLRYLLAVDDKGNPMRLSPDPMMDELQAAMKAGDLRSILSNDKLFGVDLYSVGLAEKITGMFAQLSKGPGAVRAALKLYVEGTNAKQH